MSYVDKVQVGSTTYDVRDSSAQAMVAPVYDATKTYPAGNYVTYSGKLYRCISAITTAEAWTSAHWLEVALGPDVSDLKSAIDATSGVNQWDEIWEVGGLRSDNGKDDDGITTRIRSVNYIPILPNTAYFTTQSLVARYFSADKTFISGADISNKFTTPANACFMRFYTAGSYAGGTTYGSDISINYPYTATAYVPFNMSTYKVQLQNQFDKANSDIATVNGMAADPEKDLFPHVAAAWRSGTPTSAYNANRICTKDYIDISNAQKLYLAFDGTAQCEVYLDFYTLSGGVYTFSNGYGYYTSNSTVISNNTSSGYAAFKITLKHSSGNISPTEIDSITSNIRIYCEMKDVPRKIRVMQYNIGKFNWGNGGGLATNVTEKIANYKKFFGKIQPDIVGFEEYPMDGYSGYKPTIDAGEDYEPNTTIFNQLYKYSSGDHFGVKTKDNLGFLTSTKISLDNDDETYRSKAIVNTYQIGGKTMGVVCGYVNVTAPIESRTRQFADAMTKVSSYDIGIVLIDGNAQSAEEYAAQVAAAKTAGFEVLNGDYWGEHDTVYYGTFKKADQILVKGAKMVNAVVCSDDYADLCSDHYAVYADILI